MKGLKKKISLLLAVASIATSSFNSSANELEISLTEYIVKNTEASITQNPAQFIIDTDFSSDVDDALAISTAMYYQDMKMINVKGVALCCTSTRSAHAMSALMGQHKYWDIPIACSVKTGIPISSSYHLGMTTYPHKTEYFSDVVNFYRMMLASSPEKINIVVLGQITNLDYLLKSQPDVHSTLNGYELVAEKVDTIYFVGGKSDGRLENNIFYCGSNSVPNQYHGTTRIAEAAKNVANTAPCRMVWMEADIVGSFSVGGFLEKTDRKSEDILTKALKDFGTSWGSASFDPFGIHIAALDANGLLTENMMELQTGTMRVNLNGTSYFTLNDPARNHFRVEKLANDGYYQSEINKALAYEYTKRSGNKDIRY
ncbi:MAG: nucleoside hydrolase [Lachnospiraceae bacterium]|nr:nucleoside hydrolase [Lachnospiraceae bacterium]